MQQKIIELNKLLKQYLHSQHVHQPSPDSLVEAYYEITFLQPIQESKARKLVSRHSQQSQLKIDLEKYVRDEWRQILPLIAQLRFESLVFNQIVDILEGVKCIRFEGLKELDLSSCAIQSISVLSNMNLNVLKRLNLSNNAITCLKPLRKCNAFRLQALDINNNCLISLHPLQELKTNRNMMALIIEYYIRYQRQYGHWPKMTEEIQVLWKMQAKSIRKLKIESFGRVSKLNFSLCKNNRFRFL